MNLMMMIQNAAKRASIIQSFKRAGARMVLFADSVPGSKYPILAPRTLPNGIKNSDTIQRVSGDVVLTAASHTYTLNDNGLPNTIRFTIPLPLGKSTGMGISNLGIFITTGTSTNDTENMQISSGLLYFRVLRSRLETQDVNGLLAFLNGNPITFYYELTTSIDTLNSPPPTSWIDLIGERISLNLLNRVACTENNAFAWATGANYAEANSISTDFIPVTEGTPYTSKYSAQVLFFDSAQQYIGALQSNGTVAKATGAALLTFTPPVDRGIAYVKLGIRTSYNGGGNMVTATDQQLSKGAALPPYEQFGVLPPNNATMQGLANTSDSGMAYEPLVCETGTPVEYTNLVPDPLFSDTSPWIILNGTKSASGGIMTITGNGASTLLRTVRDLGVKPPNASRLAQRIRFRLNQSGATSCNALLRDGASGTILGTTSVSNPVAGQWYSVELAQIVNCGALVENVHLFISAAFPDAATQNGKTMDIEKPQVINISTPQIAALESQLPTPLTAIECDRIFPFVTTTGVSKIGIRPLMVFDGINDYGTLANNPSVDIVGTGDFAIAVGFLTANTIPNGMQILSKNLDSTANTQFHVRLYSDGSCEVCLNGIQILVVPTANIVANTMYDLRVYRTNGRLIAKLQAVEKYNQVNSIALASQPHLRLGARSNSSDGLTNGAFFKGGMAWAIIATSAEVANIDKALDRKARDYRLMG